MQRHTFTHEFEINDNGCPFGELPERGRIKAVPLDKGIEIVGDKEGLLALAKRLIEVAHAENDGYHCHCEVMEEAPEFRIHPKGFDLIVGLE